jgi:phosphoserine aminotransferase
MEERVYNFSAGPAGLPAPVMQKAQEELLAFPGAGASIMEISHRSKAFSGVHQNAKADIKRLLDLPDNYQILFMPGGATMQFSMIAMNLLAGKSADYVHCGTWSAKAMKEAEKFGTVRTVWSGKADNFVRMPSQDDLDLDPKAAYLHVTSNETIQGIEFFEEPESNGVPLICDASSDFMSRPLPMEKYGLLYAGAQKNIGPSGMAVAIIRDDLLQNAPEGLPALLDYKLMADNDSLYNTPPCFGIYMVGLVAKWLLHDIGGLHKMEALNIEKANLLYGAIDQSGGYYSGHAVPECRSRMNIAFRLPGEDLEKKFIAEATQAGLHSLKGHRSVGGCRASIYNAMPKEGVQALCDFMAAFQKDNG